MNSTEYESISIARSRYAGCCLACGICKILCYTICCRACRPATQPKEELTLLCLGLEGAGKSTLLAELAGETVPEAEPTIGFSIKAVLMERVVLSVKELGGGPTIREYWERYFSGHDAVIFVIDSMSSDEQLSESVTCLSRCLASSALRGLPVLVVCSKQDKTGSKSVDHVKAMVESVMDGRKWSIVGSSQRGVEAVKKELEEIANSIIDN
ncbi:ADP-ribosylation factor-like protein 15 [Halichondria panicea]|uniref:ADP-ribosylation factor-like protein 15 n=1 Tax=Halichondria panicea TaxID=6063 RepID=UPI00312B83ED